MADKTLVLKVDLDCKKCYNKVRRALCQNHYEIRSQTIDRKVNTITISGPFDATSLAERLNRKAGSAIKGIEVKEPPKKVDEKPKSDAKPKTDEKPKEVKKDDKPKSDEKPKEVKKDDKPKSDAKPPEAKKSDAKPATDKPKEAAAGGDKAKSDPPKEAAPVAKAAATGPVVAYPMFQPPYGVYPMPSYQGYAEMVPVHYDYGRPVGSYDGNYAANYHGNYAGNHYYGENKPNVYGTDYFSDKDPSCSIM